MLWFRYDTKTNVSCVVLFVTARTVSRDSAVGSKKQNFPESGIGYVYSGLHFIFGKRIPLLERIRDMFLGCI